MTKAEFDDVSARVIRSHWFGYLDTVEPVRGDLFRFCHKLTQNIWDAEDLVQETLLVGFGMTARGDFHGEDSPVRNKKAYLFRTATNKWLDIQRKISSRLAENEEVLTSKNNSADPVETEEAIAGVLGVASPQEFIAFVLKDSFDYSLQDIAEFIGTSEGTIKSALSRARKKVQLIDPHKQIDPAARALATKFAEAISADNVQALKALMAEDVQIQVCNVGGGRGRNGLWTQSGIHGIRAIVQECDGIPVVLMFKEDNLIDVLQIGGDETVTRITDYCYAPETLRHVADQFGYPCHLTAYHQPWRTIDNDMVPTTALPWRE